MIARLRGELEEKCPNEVLIDVAGVGYGAAISLNTFNKLPECGEEVSLYVVTNLRENALELFAFADGAERSLFNVLRTVSGIGPRLAMAILSGIDSDEFPRVVAERDLARLVSISGVGRKTAERILVELTDKMPEPGPVKSESGPSADAVAALCSLGYKRGEALRAVSAVRADGGDGGGVEELIRGALARLS